MRYLSILIALFLWCAPATADLRITESTLSAQDQKRLGAIVGFLQSFYAARGNTAAWTDPDDIRTALSLIAEAEGDGLDPEDFAFTKLQAMAGKGHSKQLDIELTANIALLGYVLNNGKTAPGDLLLTGFWDRLSSGDPAFDLNYALETGLLRDAVGSLRPQSAHYAQLQRALRAYQAIAAAGGWPRISSGPVLRPGDKGPRVGELVRRLNVQGTAGTVFDSKVAQAVRAFQAAHGEDADGIVGKKTIAAMNVTVEQRIDQLRVNLERARWIGDLPKDRHIIVNIAGYYAAVMENGAPVWATRVIVGKQYTQTPVFLNQMEYIEFNPTWTAPRSITRNELAPKILADPGYLNRNGYYLVKASGKRVNTASVNFSAYTPRTFPYWIVQAPGKGNALGQVKFMFPNEHSVYMHDTPSRGLFDRTKRTFSHGCIRTENPLELAALLLRGQGWDDARIIATIASGQRTRAELDKPVPIAILYWTADPTPDGVTFYPDIYDRDGAVLRALNTPLQFEDR